MREVSMRITDLATAVRDHLVEVLTVGVCGAVLGMGAVKGQELWRAIQSMSIKPADGQSFTILVADLVNDPGRVETELIVKDLKSNGINVMWDARKLESKQWGNDDEKVINIARRRLEQRNADVYVWGRVSGHILYLELLGREGGSRGGIHNAAQASSRLEIPQEFRDTLWLQIGARALALVSRVTDSKGVYLADRLRPLAEKIERVLSDGDRLPPAATASLYISYGLAIAKIGEQSGTSYELTEAISAFRKALELQEGSLSQEDHQYD